eukprot:gene31281-35698_t
MCIAGHATPNPADYDAAQRVFRPDVYRAALRPLGVPLPGASSKLEGGIVEALGVGTTQGRLILGADRFFDARNFDPADLTGYLSGFEKIVALRRESMQLSVIVETLQRGSIFDITNNLANAAAAFLRLLEGIGTMTQLQTEFDAVLVGTGARPNTKPSAPAATGFWQSGHRPTLIAAFLYFDLAFMVWVLLGPLAPIIAKELALSPAEKGLMVAVPTLAGAVLRLVNGLLVDKIGPKKTGAIGQMIVIAGLSIGWLFGVNSFAGTLALGVVLGFAGASFAVALPLASRWYPAEHQGKAMGIAGMGNSGTVLASLFAPMLAKAFGWNA